MGLFQKKERIAQSPLQTYAKSSHPFRAIGGFAGSCLERRIYKELREAVPIIDAAIYKIVRLTGGFQVETPDEAETAALQSFLREVPVSGSGRGVEAFTAAYLEQLLTYGSALGEVIANPETGDITGLANAPLDRADFCLDENGVDLQIFTRDQTGRRPVRCPELILFSALNPEPGDIYGVSLLRGLPFVTNILLEIYKTIGINWDRLGNLRFAVTYNPGTDQIDNQTARERANQIAGEWSATMSSRGEQIRDFVAVGDVSIKVIGADNQILDSEVPVRQMLEQIVAKVGLPPFLLGLSWSTTERMSGLQTDILTSELEYYRQLMTPVILKICRLWQRSRGKAGPVAIEWNTINLQDMVELARANLYTAQAETLQKGGTA